MKSRPIEDYGFIGNLVTGALVSRGGSIDWLCLPGFSSDACFAALLGTPENGSWSLRPVSQIVNVRRRYIPQTLVLETIFETPEGIVKIVDFMSLKATETTGEVIRLVKGLAGTVAMAMELIIRFGYGRIVPWVQRRDFGLRAIAGPDCIDFVTSAPLHNDNLRTESKFVVKEGDEVPFSLSYHPSNTDGNFIDDRNVVLRSTVDWWQQWSARPTTDETKALANDHWHQAVLRSQLTLKALTYRPTGSIVAAPTTSLPEELGGRRNWDYRFCWIRDATLTLYALLNSGHIQEAVDFRIWLVRAAAGQPEQLQIMYGLAGERRLTEIELQWLPGYEGSKPVRIGNSAHDQLQLDVYGELLDTLHTAAKFNLAPFEASWRLQRVLLEKLETIWREPDRSIWESRSQSHQFTYSKVMAWLAFERGIQSAVAFGLDAPTGRWKEIRDTIKSCVLEAGFNEKLNTFVRHFETTEVDPSLLLLAQVGFISPEDPRFRGTVTAVERELVEDGFVRRYQRDHQENPARANEGAFIACSFWLADAYVLMKRYDDAGMLFERLLSVANDLGLLSEQYDSQRRRLVGNFPQAFSHVALVNTANNLARQRGPAKQRAEESAGHR